MERLFAGLADVRGFHVVGGGDFTLADLAAGRHGGRGNASGDDADQFLLLANATGSERVDGEERALSLHDHGNAGFLGDGQLRQKGGVAGEILGGGVFGGEDAGAVEAEHVGGAFAPAERQFQVAEHVHVHVRLGQSRAQVRGRGEGGLAAGAADDDDVSDDSGSPGVIGSGESDGIFNVVHRRFLEELHGADTTDEFPASVHEISFDGVEVGCVMHTRASESGQTEEVMLQSFGLQGLFDVGDETEEVLPLVLVADVLLKDDDGVGAGRGRRNLLGHADANLSAGRADAGHAVGRSLQHDSSELSFGDVGGGGGARFLEHHVGGVGVVLPFEDVVDAHVHEGRGIEVAEGRAEDGGVGDEQIGADMVGGSRLDVGDGVEFLGGVGHVGAGLVVVSAEETTSLTEIPSGNGDSADFGLHVAGNGHSLLALNDDLVLAGAADGGFREIQRQFGDVTIDDRLEGVEDLDVLAAGHHRDRVAFGTGFGASVVGDDGELAIDKVSGEDVRAISGEFDERSVEGEVVLVSGHDSGGGEGRDHVNSVGRSRHPVVVIVHEGPADLGHVGNDFPLGVVETGQQVVDGRQSRQLFQGDRDLHVEFQFAFSLVPDDECGFVFLDDPPEAFASNLCFLDQLGDFSRDVQVVPGPDKLGLDEVHVLFQFHDLRIGFPFLDGGFKFGVDFREPGDDGGRGLGVFGFEIGLKLGQSIGQSTRLDLFQLGLDMVQQSKKVSSHWSEFDLQLFGDGGDLGYGGNDDVLADVSDDLHGLSDKRLDFGFVFGDEFLHLLLRHFQVLANDGLDARFDVIECSLDIESDFAEMRLDPVDRLDDLGLQRSQFDHQFLVVGFEMGDQVFVEDPEFRFHLAEVLPGFHDDFANIFQVEVITPPHLLQALDGGGHILVKSTDELSPCLKDWSQVFHSNFFQGGDLSLNVLQDFLYDWLPSSGHAFSNLCSERWNFFLHGLNKNGVPFQFGIDEHMSGIFEAGSEK